MSEFEHEEIAGLPEALPAGERILWRGAPAWRSLAWRAFHIRDMLVYFVVLCGVQTAMAVAGGVPLARALSGHLWLVPAALVGAGVLALLAWLTARATIYTLTDRRVVMRIGIALPMTLNLPFSAIADAGARIHADGTGDIGVAFGRDDRIPWLVLWPHVRAWHVRRPQPMLRCVPEAATVADLLSRALAASAGQPVTATRAPSAVFAPTRLATEKP